MSNLSLSFGGLPPGFGFYALASARLPFLGFYALASARLPFLGFYPMGGALLDSGLLLSNDGSVEAEGLKGAKLAFFISSMKEEKLASN